VLTVNARGLSSIHKRVVLLYSGGVVAVVTQDKIGNPEYQKSRLHGYCRAALHDMASQEDTSLSVLALQNPFCKW
jgi:hypothetical protein